MIREQNLQDTQSPPLVIPDVSRCPSIHFFNVDCIEFMKSKPDKCYDLAIVDPPYGIGVSSQDNTKRGKLGSHYEKKDWDKEPPNNEYFEQLFRVSKNQVIWGANHFIERINKNSSCWLVWNKKTVGNTADCELAWTSFKTAVRRFDFMWEGFWQENMKNKEKRIHPTQKPSSLYRWILQEYAKEGFKILDTHGGSMSIAKACEIEGFDLDICEIDKEYFEAGVNAFNMHKRQARLF